MPKSTRITSLGRKAYNVLLFMAQDQGLDKDVFRAPLDRVVKGVDFDSHDHELIKKHLRAMVSTTVEWQSPTTGEGAAWNVSGLLAHARIAKERGQVWVEWSYAVNLKQELLEPTVFARLKLEVISQLRSHAGISLYEICTRYKDVGRTARQPWRWWRPVLSGQPETERTARLEYRIFKRDTLKPAIAEVNAITDLEVELLEHKEGRSVGEIQFLIRPKPQASLGLTTPLEPVDMALVGQAAGLGVEESKLESLVAEFGEAAVAAGLKTLSQRQAHEYPAPVRDPARYLRSLMPGEAAKLATALQAAEPGHPASRSALVPPESGGHGAAPASRPSLAPAARPASVGSGVAPVAPSRAAGALPAGAGLAGGVGSTGHGVAGGTPTHLAAMGRDAQTRRQARWTEEWIRRRREQVIEEIRQMSPEIQAELVQQLLADMERRQVHPSIRKRLQTSGWQHPLVLTEMVRFYAVGSRGEHWDQPSAQDLLAVAAELGD
ncbi:RepB family plasmid replication initiator protein [Ideonella livida]|uniref:RepB family plasmid replication initiator protein n=1 Tax=Ideonella livida TaxID=2707176 RepID=A0A7C9TN91_9BURK|nr:RepB family plasmid replication initiator protein [Ideonella livida]NDY93623.1 RepB family plasmid replication initiator protein [Ideonella livida]